MVTVAIKVTKVQKKKLDKMKKHPRETYADVIERLMKNANGV
ncbi:MAG: hypothetical protein AABX14_05150 [Candidatus Aenigmatarchaeota archaeon]